MNQYKHDPINDYAMPTMMAEKALKQLHQAALDKNYDDAIKYALEAATQCRSASAALWAMAEKEKRRDKAVVA